MYHPTPVPNPLMLVTVSGHYEHWTAGEVARAILGQVKDTLLNVGLGRIDDGPVIEDELTITDMRAGMALSLLCERAGGEIWINARYMPNDPASLRFQINYLYPGRPTIKADSARGGK